MNTSILHKWSAAEVNEGTLTHDEKSGLEVLHIKTLPALFQAIGCAKFHKRKEFPIYFRGQTDLYEGRDSKGEYCFQPSALRGAKDSDAITDVRKKMQRCVERFRSIGKEYSSPYKYSDGAIEALLQQYGMTSTWIDVVDNIWIALWFACYRAVSPFDCDVPASATPTTGSSVPKRRFIHMVRRCPRKEDSEHPYAYILLLSGKRFPVEKSTPKEEMDLAAKGGETGDSPKEDKVEMIDLRKDLPSVYIRPHAQHGLLIRSKNYANMASLIQGVIRLDLEDALEWLGEGRILLPESIFPPPNYDSGFQTLLKIEEKLLDVCEACFPIYC